MKCNHCGFEYKTSTPYCPRCGAPQNVERQAEEARAVRTERNVEPTGDEFRVPVQAQNPARTPAANAPVFQPQNVQTAQPRMNPQPAPYPQMPMNPQQPPAVMPPVNAAKTASTALACSIIGLATAGGAFHLISFILSVIGLVYGNRGMKESSMSGQEGYSTASTARTVAIVGMIISGVALFTTLLVVIIGVSLNAYFLENVFEIIEDIYDELF